MSDVYEPSYMNHSYLESRTTMRYQPANPEPSRPHPPSSSEEAGNVVFVRTDEPWFREPRTGCNTGWSTGRKTLCAPPLKTSAPL